MASGATISSTAWERRPGPTALTIWACTRKALSMEEASTSGRTVLSLAEIGLKATSKARYFDKGSYKSSTGYSYEGEWKDNLKHGFGKFTYTDGKVYEGDFANNKKEGKGT